MSSGLRLLFIVIAIYTFFCPSVLAQGKIDVPIHQPPTPPVSRLTVNGSSDVVNLNFPEDGEAVRLSVSTNQGKPRAVEVPEWLSVETSLTYMNVQCKPNYSQYSRNGSFKVVAGNRSVRVNVTQPAGQPVITRCDFFNADSNTTILSSPGETLYASDLRFLTPVLTYDGTGSRIGRTLYVKYIRPDGALDSSQSSPYGYTYKQDVIFNPGKNNTLRMKGWGNNVVGCYKPGVMRIEIYCDGELIVSKSVEIK